MMSAARAVAFLWNGHCAHCLPVGILAVLVARWQEEHLVAGKALGEGDGEGEGEGQGECCRRRSLSFLICHEGLDRPGFETGDAAPLPAAADERVYQTDFDYTFRARVLVVFAGEVQRADSGDLFAPSQLWIFYHAAFIPDLWASAPAGPRLHLPAFGRLKGVPRADPGQDCPPHVQRPQNPI